MITPVGTAMLGQNYSLDSLSPTITYRWYNENTNPRPQFGTTSTYTFPHLRLHHAGRYTCEVMITSPYLNRGLHQSVMLDITVRSMLYMLTCYIFRNNSV